MEINGNKIESDNDVLKTINDEAIQKGASEIIFTLKRNEETLNITIPSVEILKALSGERALGLYFGDELIIKNIVSGSAAEEAELKIGDKIIAINGISANNIADFRPIVMDNYSQKINITIMRNGEEIIREAIPKPVNSKTIGTYGSLGVEFESIPMSLRAALEGQSVTVAPGERVRIPTGVAISCGRRDIVAVVAARSGLGTCDQAHLVGMFHDSCHKIKCFITDSKFVV